MKCAFCARKLDTNIEVYMTFSFYDLFLPQNQRNYIHNFYAHGDKIGHNMASKMFCHFNELIFQNK